MGCRVVIIIVLVMVVLVSEYECPTYCMAVTHSTMYQCTHPRTPWPSYYLPDSASLCIPYHSCSALPPPFAADNHRQVPTGKGAPLLTELRRKWHTFSPTPVACQIALPIGQAACCSMQRSSDAADSGQIIMH